VLATGLVVVRLPPGKARLRGHPHVSNNGLNQERLAKRPSGAVVGTKGFGERQRSAKA